MKILKSKKAIAQAVAIVNTAAVSAIGSLVTLNASETALVSKTEADASDRKAFTALRKAVVKGLQDNGYVAAVGSNANTVNGHVNRWLASIAGVESPTVKSASDHFVEAGLTLSRKSTTREPKPDISRTNAAVGKEIAAYLRRHKSVLAAMSPTEKMELMAIIQSA